ncbi:hypothetical protein ACWF0M_25980 [Kribbella sp. NPDC055110]
MLILEGYQLGGRWHPVESSVGVFQRLVIVAAVGASGVVRRGAAAGSAFGS